MFCFVLNSSKTTQLKTDSDYQYRSLLINLQWSQGRIQDFGLGWALAEGLGTEVPRSPKNVTSEAKNHLRREETSPYRLTLYNVIIIIIISSTHPFVFRPFLS